MIISEEIISACPQVALPGKMSSLYVCNYFTNLGEKPILRGWGKTKKIRAR
jgi:hypothetical protein